MKNSTITVGRSDYNVTYTATVGMFPSNAQTDEEIEGVDIEIRSIDGVHISEVDIDTIQDVMSELERIEHPQYLRECKAEEDGEDFYDNSFF